MLYLTLYLYFAGAFVSMLCLHWVQPNAAVKNQILSAVWPVSVLVILTICALSLIVYIVYIYKEMSR